MNKLLIWSFIFSANMSWAQDAAKYHIQHFTTDNGLPSNGIKGMEWDEKTGFLWIATEAGISRYNGMEFSNFTKDNTPGLSHERMAYSVTNNKGAIYMSDVGGNILTIKAGAPVAASFPQTNTPAIFRYRAYLFVEDAKLREKFLALINVQKTSTVINVVELENSLVVVFNGKYAYYLTKDQVPEPVSFPDEFSGILLIGKQLFGVDKQRQLFRVKNKFRENERLPIFDTSGRLIRVNPSNTLLYWTPGMKDPILFSDNNAWLLYDREDHIEARLVCSAVPTYSFIRFAQYSDKNKTLFIGTDSKGITVINENKVLSIKNVNTDIRDRNAYYSQVELSNGSILTNESHILGPAGHPPGALPINGKFTFTVHTMGDSLLWYSQANKEQTKEVLHQYNYQTGKTKDFPRAGAVSGGFAIARTDDRVYVASVNGLGLLKDDSLVSLFKPANGGPTQQPPFTMIEFSPGKLGVASCDGLILFDVNKKTTDTIWRERGFCVRSLWKYGEYIFVSTYGKGFYIWKEGKIKPMPLDKNKFLLYAHCVVPDHYGFCWISTNRGLFKAQLSDLIDAYEKDIPQIYYHYFGKNDGMEITEMNGGCAPCALVLKNKVLSFPTMDGLLWVDPAKGKPLLPEGNIYIDEFLAGNNKVNPDSLTFITLPFQSRDIVIKLGFSAWCNKENIYLEYRLDPKDKWIPVDISKGALIGFNNLLPGSYNLQLRKLNGFGIDNYSYKEISFTIRTPWQQQPWFYALCILFLVGAITLYLRFRTRQYLVRQRNLEKQIAEKTKELKEQNELLEKNNSIKTRLISIISHDIVTPLKFVTVAGKNLQEKRNLMSEEMQQDTIREMTNTSQELQMLSTNILNWIKYQNENRRMAKENFDLQELVNQVLGILQSLAKQKNLSIINNVAPEMQVYQYYEPLKILVYNLLTNAIQFTEKGAITISASKYNGNVTVTVKDDGIGMTSEQIQRLMAEEVVITSANVDNKRGHGLGFLIIKDLVKTMDATLTIESKKDEGSSISVKMPATRTAET